MAEKQNKGTKIHRIKIIKNYKKINYSIRKKTI